MYLTHDYLVNSFNVGKPMKKLKPMDIVKDFFGRKKKVGTLLSSMVNHHYRN